MNCLLIGFSSFAQRRVIPTLSAHQALGSIDIASRRAGRLNVEALPDAKVYDDLDQALAQFGGGLVYVSLENEAHTEAVEKSLRAGNHVIVDKPAFTSLEAAERMTALARDRGLVLAEATTYGFHPVLAFVSRQFADAGTALTHATAHFTPPVPRKGYRFDRTRGGGALLDLGPYAVSLGRLLWGSPPLDVHAVVSAQESGVDTSFSLLLHYGGGRVLVGHFGFTTEYTNQIQLLGAGLSVVAPRVFSTPPDFETNVVVRHRNKESTHVVARASSMSLFLEAVLEAIDNGDTTTLSNALLTDAKTLDAVRSAARAAS